MMTYKESIGYLYKFEKFGIKYNLENIRNILNKMGNPQNDFLSYHIAGTNGKGTVSALLNSFLVESGFKVGLYTSPHISDFRERILVCGKMISEKYVSDFLTKYKPIFDKIKPTFFEIATAMAFRYFSDKKVRIAVIETGMGGRLDSTNIITPEVSIITGISYDHMQYLGDTLEKIAYEKAGIIKENIPVIHCHMKKNVEKVISDRAKEKHSREIISDKEIKINITKKASDGMTFNIKSKFCDISNIKTPLIGDFHKPNFSNALAAYFHTQQNVNKSIIKQGFRNVITNSGYHGRFEIIGRKPLMILDVAHNPEGIKNLNSNLEYLNYKRLFIVFGMMKDKDYGKCIRMLEQIDADIILTRPDYERAAAAEELYAEAKNKFRFIIRDDVRFAAAYVLGKARPQDAILVTGSFYLISDFLKAINFKYF